MVFYSLIIVLLLYFLCRGLKPSIEKKYFCILASFSLVLISGLRHPDVGEHSDTVNYLTSFDQAGEISWQTIFKNFFITYFSPSYGGEIWKDPGFSIFEKIVHGFTSNHQVYLLIIAILCIVPLSVFIYKNVKDSKSALFAYAYYIFFFFNYIPNSSIRQSIALSLLFFCYNYLQKDKLLRCLLVLILASTIHKSVFIFVLFIIIHKLNANKLVFKNAYLLFLILIFAYQFIAPYLANLGEIYAVYGESDYYSTNEKPYKFLIFIFLLYLLILIPVIIKKEQEFERYKIAYLASAFALFLSPLLFIAPAILRIIVYFAVWNFVLIPHSIELYDKSYGRFIMLGLLGLFLYMSFNSIGDYRFFWQNGFMM